MGEKERIFNGDNDHIIINQVVDKWKILRQHMLTVETKKELYNSTELKELKELIEQYEGETRKLKQTKAHIELLERNEELVKQNLDIERSRVAKLGMLKKIVHSKKSNQVISELNKNLDELDEEQKAMGELEKVEQETLNQVIFYIERAIAVIQNQFTEFNQYFPKSQSETIPEWGISIKKFEECLNNLVISINNSKDKVVAKEQEIKALLGFPEYAKLKSSDILVALELIREKNQNSKKVLNYTSEEEQQLQNYDNLQGEVSLQEEGGPRKK